METTAPRAADGAVLTRLERIAALGRRQATPGELLDELRGLLCDAEAERVSAGRGEEGGRAPRHGAARDIIDE